MSFQFAVAGFGCLKQPKTVTGVCHARFRQIPDIGRSGYCLAWRIADHIRQNTMGGPASRRHLHKKTEFYLLLPAGNQHNHFCYPLTDSMAHQEVTIVLFSPLSHK